MTVKGPKQNYLTLRPGWTDILFKLIVENTGNDCIFNFKKANIEQNEFFVRTRCSECQSELDVQSINNRTSLLIKKSKSDLPHTFQKKRKLTRTRAINIRLKLQNDSVHNIHRGIVNDIPDDLNHLPRDFVSEKSLHNLKSRENSKKETCMQQIFKLMCIPKFKNTIKELKAYPFNIIFWTNQQSFYYAQIAKNQELRISLDATGGLVAKNSFSKDTKINDDSGLHFSHIFLYLISLKNNNAISISVGQMLSAQQDSLQITYFLQRCLADFRCPRKITIDDSAALLKSCVNAFTECTSTRNYIQSCFRVLNDDDSCYLPSTYIRLDISHFVKNLMNHKTIANVDQKVKRLYLNVIGVIIQTESFDLDKKIIENALVLAIFPIEGTLEDGTVLPTGESLSMINKMIRTHDLSFIQQREMKGEVTSFDDSETEANISWYSKIYEKVKGRADSLNMTPAALTSNTRENLLYCPEFHLLFKDIMGRLPLWSAVMMKAFGSVHVTSNSMDTESRFDVLKNNVFGKFKLPVRADVFCTVMFDEIIALPKLQFLLLDSNGKEVSITYYKSFNE